MTVTTRTPGVDLPVPAEVIVRTQESASVFTLQLRLTEPRRQEQFRFQPGQFNMLALPGVGEVPISIVSDPDDTEQIGHTIRAVGRVTHALARLSPGATLGLRGPFGRGWPLHDIAGRDVLIVTGGLGCAPTVGAIRYILHRRHQFGRLTIIQGVKHEDDLLWRDQYAAWQAFPDTSVLIAADVAGRDWPWHVGRITELFGQAELLSSQTVAMMCGPEGMMHTAITYLQGSGMPAASVFMSLERSMHCAIGLCGHCQLGPKFVCRDGPVFCYNDIRPYFDHPGF